MFPLQVSKKTADRVGGGVEIEKASNSFRGRRGVGEPECTSCVCVIPSLIFAAKKIFSIP